VDTLKSVDTEPGRETMVRRRRFSRDFKKDAVRMLGDGKRSVIEVSQELGVRPDMLRKWRKLFEEDQESAFPGHGGIRVGDEELIRLRREVRRLREEREILKKAVAIFSEGRPK